MRLLALAFAVFAAPALAEDRWMSIPMPPPMPTPVATGMAPVNGIQMYFATYGAGNPVLLIHGGLGNADIWSNEVIDLMKDHLVIVADSRGHGRSTRTAEPFGYDLMSSDYLALLDYLKVGKVDLVGWSDGGIIGLDIAMSHPEGLVDMVDLAGDQFVGDLKQIDVVGHHQRIDLAEGQKVAAALKPQYREHRLRPEDSPARQIPVP